MKKREQIFAGNNGKVSSKRVIGAVILAIAMILLIDSHFTDRDLNDIAFNSVLYTGGIMIIGGVLENRLGGNTKRWRKASRGSENEREGYASEHEED